MNTSGKSTTWRKYLQMREVNVFSALVVIVILMSLLSPYFLTRENIFNLLRGMSTIGIMAIGQTMVIITGGIDLSVGSVLAVSSMLTARLITVHDENAFLSLLFGLSSGLLLGTINGLIITRFKINPFIATLATLSVFRGTNYLISQMITVTDFPASFVKIGQGSFLGIPIPVYIMLIVVTIAFIFMKKSKFGFHLVATGGNVEASRVNGINITSMRFLAYILCGLCVAIAAVIMTARTASAQVGAGTNMELDAIAAVVIGGTSLSGGNANVWGTLFGCLVVGFVNNGLNLLNIDPSWQVVAKGMLILLAVVLDTASTGLYTKKSRKL